MNWLTELLSNNMLPCFYKKYFGMDCPGCGMQRSALYLAQGDLEASLMMYPALIPTIIMVMFTAFHVIFKFKNGHRTILYLFITNTIIILINYILKLI